MRCLAVDVGNTSAALGIVSGKSVRHVRHINGGLNNFDELDSALTELMKQGSIDGVILCSVVPSANRLWRKLLRRHTSCEPIVVSHTINLGVKIDYPKPESIGPDRLANACGAIAKFGAPAIVADFGTALTFDVIDSASTYIGGVIAPGLPLMTEYLADRTELLPLINLKGRCAKVGRSTESAMRIGAHVGYRGMVREIVEHLKQNLGPSPVALCATGGFARWILSDADMPFVVEPNLTLYGLGKIFELNGE
jgi:type III pantothenate kinase